MDLNQLKDFRGRGSEARVARIHRAALVLAAVLLAVTTLSAFIRLANAGVGCEPRPACYGERLRAAQQGQPTRDAPGVVAARLAHRVLGGMALLVVAVIAMGSWLGAPVLRREGAAAIALLALAGALAALGVVSAGARLPAVTIGNLVGGFAMLAIAWRIAAPPSALAPLLRAWAAAGAALLLTQVALGGLVSAGYAGLSCPLLGCWPDAPAWHALDPFREPAFDAPTNPGGAVAQALHRAGAALVVLVLAPLGVVALRHGARRFGAALLALLALQVALGIGLVALALPLPLALAHNVVAALLFATIVRAA
jgi:cytochrome c oxidase assembly protein subunit 15